LAGVLSLNSNPLGARFRRASLAVAVWAPALLILIGGGFIAADLQYAPTQSTRLLAVFPPWWASDRTLAAVGGIAAASSARGFIVSIAGDQPNLAQLLHDRGALWVLDGLAFPACFSPMTELNRP
jgi:hypothetical protein